MSEANLKILEIKSWIELLINLHPLGLTPPKFNIAACLWKMMVGKLLFFWEGNFSGAISKYMRVKFGNPENRWFQEETDELSTP